MFCLFTVDVSFSRITGFQFTSTWATKGKNLTLSTVSHFCSCMIDLFFKYICSAFHGRTHHCGAHLNYVSNTTVQSSLFIKQRRSNCIMVRFKESMVGFAFEHKYKTKYTQAETNSNAQDYQFQPESHQTTWHDVDFIPSSPFLVVYVLDSKLPHVLLPLPLEAWCGSSNGSLSSSSGHTTCVLFP